MSIVPTNVCVNVFPNNARQLPDIEAIIHNVANKSFI